MTKSFQRVIVLVAVVLATLPASLFAESRIQQRTELERLAADLERVLCPGSARLERGTSASASRPVFNELALVIADGSPRRGYKGPTVVAMYGAR